MKVKKMIAPVIITILLIIYFSFYAWGAFSIVIVAPFWLKLLGVLIALALIAVSIFVMVERINEIRSGEEDDLSKY